MKPKTRIQKTSFDSLGKSKFAFFDCVNMEELAFRVADLEKKNWKIHDIQSSADGIWQSFKVFAWKPVRKKKKEQVQVFHDIKPAQAAEPVVCSEYLD